MSYGPLQIAVLAVFAGIAVAVAGVFALVARSSRRDAALEEVQRVGYRLRRFWLALLAALLMAVVGTSLFALPYARGGSGRTIVKVTGGQFYWILDPAGVPAGTRVRFDVTAADVNHGFGLYDPRGRLIGSVQAMPGYRNKLDLTLSDPGTYRIRCFEFCGLDHHRMEATFRVAGP